MQHLVIRYKSTNLFFTIQNINALTHRFIHCAMMIPFILHYFLFSLTSKQKGEKSLKRYWWIVQLTATYYITLMVKCMCAWLHHQLKLLLRVLLPCTNSSQQGWLHVETYMHVSVLWFANTAAAKIATKCQWR